MAGGVVRPREAVRRSAAVDVRVVDELAAARSPRRAEVAAGPRSEIHVALYVVLVDQLAAGGGSSRDRVAARARAAVQGAIAARRAVTLGIGIAIGWGDVQAVVLRLVGLVGDAPDLVHRSSSVLNRSI